MGESCPHCGAAAIELEAEGAIRRCRACGRSALRGADAPNRTASAAAAAHELATMPSAFATANSPPLARRRPAGPGEVPILPAAGFALLATLLFYGALRWIPDTRLAELFVERGWVQYAITFVSSWALALLAAKRRRLARERRMLGRDWLARPGAGALLRPEDVDATLAHLAGQADFDFDALLARRLVRALRHFQARRRVVEVVEFLNAEARADEGRIDASYGLIRVFIWAVPTLGFIGTVIGIGAAVGGFSTTLETASSIEGMRESIESVTGGLGVAFDTTLLALVMSIVVMFPSNALQRLEEAFLGEVDDDCAEHLVRRLADESGAESDDAALDRLVERLIAALRKRDAAGG
ncbi:MAG: MotA/TolQ/ExbB proton channel family protein [Deltaproteobacteria bacterium]|nr:MotA/TolQ/ExbB proton channel family protein [Deltaproteobacteria bacterium]